MDRKVRVLSAPFSYVEIEAVDELEFEIPCDVQFFGDPCGENADWIITKSCCGATAYICDPHFHTRSARRCRACDFVSEDARKQTKNAMRIK